MPHPPRDAAPSRTLRLHVIATLILWGVAYVLQTVEFSSSAMGHDGSAALRRIAVTGSGLMLSLGLFCINRPLRRMALGPRGFVALLTSVLAAAIYAGVNHVLFYVLAPEWGNDSLWDMAYILRMTFWVFAAWNALYFAIEYDGEARDKALRLTAAEALAVDAQNRMLRYQINPHFLFNTLNALSTLILDRRPAEAERMVLALSTFLRHSLAKDLGELIPLGDELAIQAEYLSIEKIRFGDRLKVIEDTPDALKGALVPNMILQPLVENTVKHGLARSSAPVTLRISAAEEAGGLVLTVSDDALKGSGPEPPHLGVGLENVRRRLELAFGSSGRFHCGARKPSGFEATLHMPLVFA